MERTIHVRIVHRNRLFRECLVSVLAEDHRFDIQAVDHSDARELELLEESGIDVVLIDLNLPDQAAVELTGRLRRQAKQSKLLLLAYASSQSCLIECIAAGAHGCILETSSLSELEEAMEKVLSGETFCSQEIVQTMFDRLAQTGGPSSWRPSSWRRPAESVNLTPRELEVVHLISERLSNKQIAKRLSISIYTVKNHVHNIVEKLQVEDRHEAVEFAQRQRWLKK
ncbi:MAG TPA: response regulator transcription factor [Thermoguttaceae bacterium]|nr:response regulator transcription factor [Thermoguttaceae bacterium]